MTEVVAALIWDEGKFLACQRPAHKARGLLWEFVGGKVEPGESLETALIRECREELGITVRAGAVFMELCHEYADITVHLTLLEAVIAEGTPRLLEHEALRWLTPEETEELAFCPADAEILARLRRSGGVNSVRARLFARQDTPYAAFQAKLMPTVAPERIIGVRTPALRALAKELRGTTEAAQFMAQLPHGFYDENNLHGFLIAEMKDYVNCIAALERFLPQIDNWATCDLLSPAVFKKHRPELLAEIRLWLASERTYTIRFGIEMLMSFYLDEAFAPEYLTWVAAVRSEEYYVNMMIAWYFATALAKQYEAALPYLTQRQLGCWTHNKTIQKAVESYRITPEQKAYLRTLRWK